MIVTSLFIFNCLESSQHFFVAVEWGKSHLVLRGHRSIVNQVRYNKQNNLIASSGVEKMVKVLFYHINNIIIL